MSTATNLSPSRIRVAFIVAAAMLATALSLLEVGSGWFLLTVLVIVVLAGELLVRNRLER